MLCLCVLLLQRNEVPSSLSIEGSNESNSCFLDLSSPHWMLQVCYTHKHTTNCTINPLTPNDDYSGRTAQLTSKRRILYIYSTNIGTEYFKLGMYSSFFPLQNAVCFINLTYLVPVLFIF